jgi:hypothetical protein
MFSLPLLRIAQFEFIAKANNQYHLVPECKPCPWKRSMSGACPGTTLEESIYSDQEEPAKMCALLETIEGWLVHSGRKQIFRDSC